MPSQRPWGVLAYIVADHANLPSADADELDAVALQEAEKMVTAACGRDDMYLSVHLDRTLTRGSLRITVPGRTEELPEEQAGVKGLRRFLASAREHCPAERYLVVLWGHGGGPLGMFADPDPGPVQGTARGELTLPELPKVLERGARGSGREAVDILLIKSCYAATLEAAREIGPHARFLLCSQARVPQRTWTIWQIFSSLGAAKSTETVARGLLDAIGRHYQSVTERRGRAEIPFTLLRPSAIHDLVPAMRELSAHLLLRADDPAVAAAIERARPDPSGDQALLDVTALCRALSAIGDPALATAACAVAALARERLVLAHEPAVSAFGGVGLFHLPRNPLQREDSFANDVTRYSYGRLAFPRETNWGTLAFPHRPVTTVPPLAGRGHDERQP